MSTSLNTNTTQPRDTAYWAHYVAALKVTRTPTGALNLNVEGRQVVGPLQGFGPMWQKTYQIALQGSDITPSELITVWKEHFGQFWPKGSRFYPSLHGIVPGEVALINASIPGGLPVPVSTGVFVLYADEESFTLMTPEGHPFSAWITFSAYEEEGRTVAQVRTLMRANDPVYEIGLRLTGSKGEDYLWRYTLTALAAHFDVESSVQMQKSCLDPKLQWSQAKNVWQNAGIRTVLYEVLSPVRWAKHMMQH